MDKLFYFKKRVSKDFAFLILVGILLGVFLLERFIKLSQITAQILLRLLPGGYGVMEGTGPLPLRLKKLAHMSTMFIIVVVD